MFGRHRFTFLVLALAIAVAGAAPTAQTATGTIEGRVFDRVTGDPLPGATVLLDGSAIVVRLGALYNTDIR